jgi:hypothetical protein
MTASSTRCCRSISTVAALIILWIGVAIAAPARADGIQVRKAALISAEDGYVLEAEFDVTLTHTLEEALNKGVPLYFALEFELTSPRWYWLNEKLSNTRHQYRLSFNALTRQYRVGVRTLYQNFASLPEALGFMSRVRVHDIAETGALRMGNNYTAALRLRLDSAQLPRPFQVSAVGSREWSISSDWHRWTVSP